MGRIPPTGKPPITKIDELVREGRLGDDKRLDSGPNVVIQGGDAGTEKRRGHGHDNGDQGE